MPPAFFNIILPVYNRARLIRRSLDSLFAQSCTDWELWAIDDGSTDGTLEVLRSLALHHPRLRVLTSEHRGQAQARNSALPHLNGNYVTFLDSDDEYQPEHLALHHEFLANNTQLDMLYGSAEVIGDPWVPDIHDLKQRVNIADCALTGTFFIRREALCALGGFPLLGFGEDYALLEKAKSAGYRVGRSPHQSYRYYRTESDSLCQKIIDTVS